MGVRRDLKNLMLYLINKEYKKSSSITTISLTQISDVKLLEGKNIVITGGSSGIGYAIAKRSLQSGANVVITGRNEQKLKKAGEKLLAGIDSNKLFVGTAVHDISNCNSDNYKRIEDIFPEKKVDILVNNAGIAHEFSDYCRFTTDDYDNLMNINLRGQYFITQYFVEQWLKREARGNIVNIASNSGLVGGTTPYVLSKHGVVALTQGIAKDYYKNGIRCNAVAPDVTISNITSWSASFDKDGNISDNWVKRGRVFLPEEIAEVVLFLMSDRSICINGQVLACDNSGSLAENTVG